MVLAIGGGLVAVVNGSAEPAEQRDVKGLERGVGDASPASARLLAAIAVNQVGLDGVAPKTWVDLADLGCETGGWDHDVAARLAAEFLTSQQLDGRVEPVAMSQVVWQLTVAWCRELAPPDALRAGPPGLSP